MTIDAVLAYQNAAIWYSTLLRGTSQREHFIVGFAIMATGVGALELLGFSVIWRMFVDKKCSSASNQSFSQMAE